ncbi:MAG: hypothetical protein M3134_06415 [Actinomycetota bacterium]|nr:hypothetical protein [Actinomycetota bacterium]
MSGGVLEELREEVAFRTVMPFDELAALHIPFTEFGFDAAPEEQLVAGLAQNSGLTLLVGRPGNGKSSILAHVAYRLSAAPAEDGRTYLPLFVPVSARADDGIDVTTFGAMAIANLLASFDDLSEEQEKAFSEATAEQVTREGPTRTLNAKLGANVFGANVEGGIESRSEVVSITSGPLPLDEFGGLATLAQTLRGRKRELIVIVEDTDGWTVGSDDEGREVARRFFGDVLAPLSRADVSIVVAVQTAWTDMDAFVKLNERALRRLELPTFDAEEQALATVRRIIVRRMEWKLGGRRDAADAVSDEAVARLAADLRSHGSIRAVLTLLRDTLDGFGGQYPERIEVEHLSGSA